MKNVDIFCLISHMNELILIITYDDAVVMLCFAIKEAISNSPSAASSQRRVSIRAADQRSLHRSRRKFSSMEQPRMPFEFKVLVIFIT